MSFPMPLTPGERCNFDDDPHGTSSRKFPFEFGLYSQTPERISSSLIAYIGELGNPGPQTGMSQIQIQGVRRWKDLRSARYSHLSTEEHLQLYSECIDDVFFGRLLKSFYKLSVVDIASIPGNLAEVSPNGWPRLPSSRGHEVDIKIGKESNESPKPIHRLALLKYHVELLLHEMIHAMFRIYSCHTCPSCITKFQDEVGCSGHSILWQRVANSIESAVNKNEAFRISNGNFDLYRTRSFRYEYQNNYNLRESLTISELEGLGLNVWTSRDVLGSIEIQHLLQARDKLRSVNRRKKAAADRKRGPQPKPAVSSGRISKSDRPNSRGCLGTCKRRKDCGPAGHSYL